METFGLPLGIVSLFAVLIASRRMTFGVVSVVVALSFAGIWIGSSPSDCGDIGTEVQLRMCQQSHAVWDAYRLLTIGLPGLVVLLVWGFKLRRLASQHAGW